MATPNVVILTDFRGWHEAQLRRALRQRGVAPILLSLKDCCLDLNCATGLYLGHDQQFSQTLPDGVFVRFIPGGSFEQVTFSLSILHALRTAGVVVYNDARSIERSVDKAMTSWLLARAGVATPAVWCGQSLEQASAVVAREIAAGRELVLKPLFGARGQGLRRLASVAELPTAEVYNGLYYLQTFIDAKPSAQDWRDWRVFVINGRAVAAMERRSKTWITNRARGGSCYLAALVSALTEPAEQAVQALGLAYAGVDLVAASANQYWVLEVNGLPAWQGLQTVVEADITQCLVDDWLRQIQSKQ